MSVDTPDSGDVITKSSVESMHSNVQEVVNAVTYGQMGGATLDPSQLPSLIHTADFLDNTTAETFDYADPFDEADLTSSGGWTELTSYRLNNSGSGYTLPHDGFIYAYCSLRVKDWYFFSSLNHSYAGEEQVWANLFFQFNGSDDKQVRNNRFINLKPPLRELSSSSKTSSDDASTIEDTISIAWLEKVSAGTLNKISIVAAANLGGATQISFNDVQIIHGTIGFFYIPVAV